jgi:calcium permeable stress-gated cation channel
VCVCLSVSFFTGSAKLQRTEKAVDEYRKQFDTRKPESYGFASMASVPYAHVVTYMLRQKRPKGTDVILAPNPRDIVRFVVLCMMSLTAILDLE